MHKRKVRKGNGRIHDLLKFINSDINIYYIVQWFTFFLPYIYSEKEREGGGWGMGEGWITENLLPQENYFMDRFASDKKYKNKIFLCLAVWKFLLLFFVKKKDLFRGPFSVIPLIAHVLWMCVCMFEGCCWSKKMNILRNWCCCNGTSENGACEKLLGVSRVSESERN